MKFTGRSLDVLGLFTGSRSTLTNMLGVSAPSIETSEAGRELAYVMADALADCGCLRSAVAHLEAVEARRPLPLEYQRKRARWTGQDDVPARERPVLRAI